MYNSASLFTKNYGVITVKASNCVRLSAQGQYDIFNASHKSLDTAFLATMVIASTSPCPSPTYQGSFFFIQTCPNISTLVLEKRDFCSSFTTCNLFCILSRLSLAVVITVFQYRYPTYCNKEI